MSKIPVPEPSNLGQFLKPDPITGKPTAAARTAAIQLGKALFWDMQAGSDGVTACASCHYRAGADPIAGTAPVAHARRDKNQLHPGHPGPPGPDTIFGNNSTVIKTFNQAAAVDPVTLLPVPVILRATGFPLDPLVPGVTRFAPNYTLQPLVDFPLFNVLPATARLVLVDPVTGLAPINPLIGITNDAVGSIRDTNDVVGSQGIRLAQFTGIALNANTAVDSSTPLTDALFTLGGGVNVRQVTGRNAPSVVNAVFNYTNFWDGRANNIFNGATPLGPLDQSARIWENTSGTPGAQPVQVPTIISNASLASQAVGPPLSDVEMSFRGRTFPELGQKMLNLPRPLNQQLVHPNDSVFSAPVQLSRATLNADGTVTGNTGLNRSYTQLIQDAFQDKFWNGASPQVGFTQMEANFALFWGLAIQLYEATLVSDKTPFDLFQQGNQNAMSFAAQQGLGTFDSKCAVCHSGTEFTSAVVGSNLPGCFVPNCNPTVFTSNTNHSLIKQGLQNADIFPLPGLVSFDEGFFNIGVRPTADDIGRGAALSGFPLSFTRLAKLQAAGQLPFAAPQLPPLTPANQADIVQGAFKTPGLRNVELTAPYFHNGSALTLDQVVEFYARGGSFPNNPDMAAAMQAIGNLRGDPARRAEVVAFLNALTDERVRQEKAPFDHPELLIPNGADTSGADVMIPLLPTGGAFAPVAPGLILNPVVSPTILTSQAISGTILDAVKTTATVAVSVNGGPAASATVNCIPDPLGLTCTPTNTWNFTAAGLAVGNNTITVTATDVTGGVDPAPAIATIQVLPTATISGRPQIVTRQTNASLTVGGAGVDAYQYKVDNGPWITTDFDGTPLTIDKLIALGGLADGTHTVAALGKNTPLNLLQPEANATTVTWTVKVNPPVLTVNPLVTPTRLSSQTISGTVELGLVPVVRADATATIGPVAVVGGSGIAAWSCQVSGLKKGTTNFTVTATDVAQNVTSGTTAVTVVTPDGNIKGTGAVDISDALTALRITVGLVAPTPEELLRGDVAPLNANGVPAPDDKIDVADAIVILRKTVGLVNF